jgi:sporulation protein YlmC with PRC-barrel domain
MISCEDILQRTVIDAAGLAIGEVDSILLDPSSWLVKAIRIRLRREMTEQVGVKKSLFRKASVDIPTTAVQSIGDAVLLHVQAEELRETSPSEEQEARAT